MTSRINGKLCSALENENQRLTESGVCLRLGVFRENWVNH